MQGDRLVDQTGVSNYVFENPGAIRSNKWNRVTWFIVVGHGTKIANVRRHRAIELSIFKGYLSLRKSRVPKLGRVIGFEGNYNNREILVPTADRGCE